MPLQATRLGKLLHDPVHPTLGPSAQQHRWHPEERQHQQQPVKPPASVAGACLRSLCLSAAISLLSPFELADKRQPFGWFPFLGYFGNNWFPAVSHVIEITLIYFPFGFAMRVARLNQQAVRAALLLVVVAAVGIEYAQSWFVGRYPDVTDVAFSALGGVLGSWFGGRGAQLFERARASAVRGWRAGQEPSSAVSCSGASPNS